MKIEFYYDFGSPNAYLVHKTLPKIAKAHGVPIVFRPILLGGVFKATNNKSPMEAFANVAGKLAYEARETQRFIENRKITFQPNPHFPVNTIALMRGAIFAIGKPWEQSYRDTMFTAMWVDQEKMDDPATVMQVMEKAGLPSTEILSASQDPSIKTALIEATSQAVARGVFGAPTLIANEDMFFGKHSLMDLETMLASSL
jgi:2-hydroxychromene-2-carboxylate isomerase